MRRTTIDPERPTNGTTGADTRAAHVTMHREESTSEMVRPQPQLDRQPRDGPHELTGGSQSGRVPIDGDIVQQGQQSCVRAV